MIMPFVSQKFTYETRVTSVGPRQANLVLIAYSSTRAVSPEAPLLAHTSIESRGTFRQKARSLAPLNGWACAVKICHDGMLEDTNSLDAVQLVLMNRQKNLIIWKKKNTKENLCVFKLFQHTGTYFMITCTLKSRWQPTYLLWISNKSMTLTANNVAFRQ